MCNHSLAETGEYILKHEYEVAYLIIKSNGKRVIVGDFYGDPTCGYISNNEDYCIVGGDGIIIYYLQEPFENYTYDNINSQWKEIRKTDFWIENIYSGTEENTVLLMTETGIIYELDINLLQLREKIIK